MMYARRRERHPFLFRRIYDEILFRIPRPLRNKLHQAAETDPGDVNFPQLLVDKTLHYVEQFVYKLVFRVFHFTFPIGLGDGHPSAAHFRRASSRDENGGAPTDPILSLTVIHEPFLFIHATSDRYIMPIPAKN